MLIRLNNRARGEFLMNADQIVSVERCWYEIEKPTREKPDPDTKEGSTIYHFPYHPEVGQLGWTAVDETLEEIQDRVRSEGLASSVVS